MGKLGPNVAAVAVGFRRNQPRIPPLAILDACLKFYSGRLSDLGDALAEGREFSLLVCEAFGHNPMEPAVAIEKLAPRYKLQTDA